MKLVRHSFHLFILPALFIVIVPTNMLYLYTVKLSKNNVTIGTVQQNSVLPYSNKSIVLYDTSEKAHAITCTTHTTMNSSRWFYRIKIHNGMNSDTRNM